MNPEQQRIAIAEACGWTWHGDDSWPKDPNNVYWKKGRLNYQILPDYLNNLNAMHEAEKVLRKPMEGSDTDTIIADRMHKYAELIGYAFDATASQRAEAFLRTIGKWEESK